MATPMPIDAGLVKELESMLANSGVPEETIETMKRIARQAVADSANNSLCDLLANELQLEGCNDLAHDVRHGIIDRSPTARAALKTIRLAINIAAQVVLDAGGNNAEFHADAIRQRLLGEEAS